MTSKAKGKKTGKLDFIKIFKICTKNTINRVKRNHRRKYLQTIHLIWDLAYIKDSYNSTTKETTQFKNEQRT